MSELTWPPRYDVGDLVDVTIHGAQVTELWDEGEVPQIVLTSVVAPGDHQTLELRLDDTGVSVEVAERRSPKQWPPLPGDVWRDRDGFAWFAVERSAPQPAGTYRALVCCDGSRVADPWGEPSEPAAVNRDFGPLELIHRDPPPAAQPALVDTAPDDDAGGSLPYDLTGSVVPVDELRELYAGITMPVHDLPAPGVPAPTSTWCGEQHARLCPGRVEQRDQGGHVFAYTHGCTAAVRAAVR